MFYKRIKAWHPKLKQMFKVTQLDFKADIVYCDPFIGDKYGSETIFDIDEVILLQESGLEDEVGFNVFEGDIIDFEGIKCVLSYGDYGDAITGNNGFGWFLDGKQFMFPYLGGGKKVGTVFENPDMVIGDNYVN